jgi:hypothetical protein
MISVQLMKSLEEAFPMRDFEATNSVANLNYHYGQRSVINFLRNQYEIQNENILNPN